MPNPHESDGSFRCSRRFPPRLFQRPRPSLASSPLRLPGQLAADPPALGLLGSPVGGNVAPSRSPATVGDPHPLHLGRDEYLDGRLRPVAPTPRFRPSGVTVPEDGLPGSAATLKHDHYPFGRGPLRVGGAR